MSPPPASWIRKIDITANLEGVAAGEVRLVPEFVSPYASAVTGNQLRPFPSAPLRTARESFDLKRLASGLCVEPVLLRSLAMNGLVALLTAARGLAAPSRHEFDPGWLLP